MGLNIKKLLPSRGDYLSQGMKLFIINVFIFLIVGGGSFILFQGVVRVREWGFHLPLPLWLVLLGASIPCFIFWFSYGKRFGSFLEGGRLRQGLALGILGDIPGFLVLFIVVNNSPRVVNPEIFRVMTIMLFLAIFMIPILVVLGALDQKD